MGINLAQAQDNPVGRSVNPDVPGKGASNSKHCPEGSFIRLYAHVVEEASGEHRPRKLTLTKPVTTETVAESQFNIDLTTLVETYNTRYAKHDLAGLLAMMDDDIHIYFPIDEKPKVGKEQIRRTWELSFGKIIPDIRPEVHSIIVQGNRAAIQFTERGTVHVPVEAAKKLGIAPVGRPYITEIGSFFTFTPSGLIKEIRSYWDTGKYAKQLGIDIGIIQSMSANAASGNK